MAMERLTTQDLMMLWADDYGWPQDIGALAILDASGLVGPDGRVRIDAVRAAIERRLHLVPRFRQLLYTPRRGLGVPLWVDAHSFDLTEHVRVRRLAAPADEAQLLFAVEQLRARRLDRSRPLFVRRVTGSLRCFLGVPARCAGAVGGSRPPRRRVRSPVSPGDQPELHDPGGADEHDEQRSGHRR
jgi:hypothetical protein